LRVFHALINNLDHLSIHLSDDFIDLAFKAALRLINAVLNHSLHSPLLEVDCLFDLQTQVVLGFLYLKVDASSYFTRHVCDLVINLSLKLLLVLPDYLLDSLLDLLISLANQTVESVRQVSLLIDESLFNCFDLAAE